MSEQLALTFERPAVAEREQHPRLPDLTAALAGQGWRTAADLKDAGFEDRELREIVASDLEGRILSFPGSPGYRLFDEASVEEIRRADALKTQGERMTSRWLTYQKRLHRRGGAPR